MPVTARIVPVFAMLPTRAQCQREGLGGFRPDRGQPRQLPPGTADTDWVPDDPNKVRTGNTIMPVDHPSPPPEPVMSYPPDDLRRDDATDRAAAEAAINAIEADDELADESSLAVMAAVLALRHLRSAGPAVLADVLALSGYSPVDQTA